MSAFGSTTGTSAGTVLGPPKVGLKDTAFAFSVNAFALALSLDGAFGSVESSLTPSAFVSVFLSFDSADDQADGGAFSLVDSAVVASFLSFPSVLELSGLLVFALEDVVALVVVAPAFPSDFDVALVVVAAAAAAAAASDSFEDVVGALFFAFDSPAAAVAVAALSLVVFSVVFVAGKDVDAVVLVVAAARPGPALLVALVVRFVSFLLASDSLVFDVSGLTFAPDVACVAPVVVVVVAAAGFPSFLNPGGPVPPAGGLDCGAGGCGCLVFFEAAMAARA